MHLNTTLPELPKFRILVIHGECDLNTDTAISESSLINEPFFFQGLPQMDRISWPKRGL